MLTSTNIPNNDNIIRSFLVYLDIKDLSSISQCNKKLYKLTQHFDTYWREACNNHFCSSYDYNKYFALILSCINATNSDKVDCIHQKADLTWKKFFQLGIQIQNNWSIFGKTNVEDQIIIDDIERTHAEIYMTLKEYFSLPKLRKENFHVENDLNSILQTFMYDFIYDQQDLYEYYDGYFKNGNLDSVVEVKNPELPFTFSLENLVTHIKECQSSQNKQLLAQYRWYVYEEESTFDLMVDNEDLIELSRKSSIELTGEFLKKQTNFNENFLLGTLNKMFLTFTHFCKHSYRYLMSIQNNDRLFINEYLKRYKSYIEASIYLNEFLENFNVLVNYTYDYLFNPMGSSPKFSVLRMMVIIWNREVLNKLKDDLDNHLFVNKVVSVYENYLSKQINIINKSDIFNFNSFKIEPIAKDHDISSIYSLSTNSTSENSGNRQNNRLFNKSLFDLQGNSEAMQIDDDSSDDVNYLLEQSASVLCDSFCHEFNVFYLNHSDYEIESPIYSEFVDRFSNVLLNSIDQTKDENIGKVIEKFQSCEFLNSKLFANTKNKILMNICEILSKRVFNVISIKFNEHVEQNINGGGNLTQKTINDFLLIHSRDVTQRFGCLIEVLEKMNISMGSELNNFNNYMIISFLKEKSGIIPAVNIFVDIENWKMNFIENQMISNKQVEKELKRRNIPLFLNRNQSLLYSLMTKASLKEIMQAVNAENYNNNNNMDIDMEEKTGISYSCHGKSLGIV